MKLGNSMKREGEARGEGDGEDGEGNKEIELDERENVDKMQV
jgi:hypothetical protein